jgi:hypothetical protein
VLVSTCRKNSTKRLLGAFLKVLCIRLKVAEEVEGFFRRRLNFIFKKFSPALDRFEISPYNWGRESKFRFSIYSGRDIQKTLAEIDQVTTKGTSKVTNRRGA